MLSPEYLEAAPQELEILIQSLEEFIIREIARRIVTSENEVMTQSALNQYNIAEGVRISIDKIQQEVARITRKSESEINALLDDAFRESIKFGANIAEKAGTPGLNIDVDPVFLELLEGLKRQTSDTIKNITGTTGFAYKSGGKIKFKPIAKFLQDTLGDAAFKASSGATDYNTAIKQAIRTMSNSGVRTVDYASGHTDKIDVASRRAVMTGISQVSGRIAERTAEILDTDLMEITAHASARPSHAEWQGQIVDRGGRDKRYLTLDDIGYGRVDGFKGANCRHDWFPYVLGVSERVYTDKELKELDPPPIDYEGKTYTGYQATQEQRKLERAIRASKRALLATESAIKVANADSKKGLEQYYTDVSIRLKRQRELYRKFSKAANMPEQNAQSQVQGFGKSEAQRARTAANK